MSQYTVGRVSVTNNSSAVVGVGTVWLSSVSAGELFNISGSSVTYQVSGVTDDNHLTLSTPYGGTTATNQPYAITRDFTPSKNLPLINPGDLNSAALVNRAFSLLDSEVSLDPSQFATAAQGTKADTAVQPSDLGSAASQSASAFAAATHNHAPSDITNLTPAVAAIIGSHVEGGTDVDVSYDPVTGKTTVTYVGEGGSGVGIDDTSVSLTSTWSSNKINLALGDKATSAQGTKADTALQPSGNLGGLTDLAAARSNLGLGAAAVLGVGSGTGSLLRADGDGAGLTGIQAIDLVARDQIALTNLRLLLNSTVSSGALLGGRQWELTSDEWATGSSGYVLVSGPPGYYTNTGTVRQSTGSILSTSGWNGSTWVNREVPLPNGASISSLHYYLSGADAGAVAKIVRRNAAGNYDGVASVAFAHPGGGWASVAVAFTVPATGSYYVGLYQTVLSNSYLDGQARAVAVGNATGTGVAMTEATGGVVAVGYAYIGNMTLLSPAVTVSSAPSYASAYALYHDDSGTAVLGTDLTVELSRDGGTTWTSASIATLAAYDGSYTLIRARADLSGQPSGTSLMARLKTYNPKAQRIAAPALYAE